MSVELLHGECIELMRAMPDNTVDAIVTDPPYGLGFMGKAWDALPPGEEWARECLRVLKPGGYLLAFGGTRTWHRLAVAVEDAGFEIRDSIAWMHGQGFPKGKGQLKPAFEPVVMARKKTDAPRTGLLQIDAARIEGAKGWPDSKQYARGIAWGDSKVGNTFTQDNSQNPSKQLGRWPANVILDESQAEALDTQSGTLTAGNFPGRTRKAPMFDGIYNGGNVYEGKTDDEPKRLDGGGASRFFYVAKAAKRERPQGDVAHPTVKPLKLMRYLVRLVTPAGGTVLDPFAGSGTTAEACILEGFNCVAIEREADYLPLIAQRIQRATAA